MPLIKPKPRVEVKFEVKYTPALATKVFDFMSKCDLGINGGEYPHTFIYSWTTTTKVDKAYLSKMRGAIRKFLESEGITQIHSIKRVK